jgi:hypothetical protein
VRCTCDAGSLVSAPSPSWLVSVLCKGNGHAQQGDALIKQGVRHYHAGLACVLLFCALAECSTPQGSATGLMMPKAVIKMLSKAMCKCGSVRRNVIKSRGRAEQRSLRRNTRAIPQCLSQRHKEDVRNACLCLSRGPSHTSRACPPDIQGSRHHVWTRSSKSKKLLLVCGKKKQNRQYQAGVSVCWR